jgi:hypothetical protein
MALAGRSDSRRLKFLQATAATRYHLLRIEPQP